VRLRVLAALAACIGALWLALGTSPAVHPARAAERLRHGVLGFYDATVPFDPQRYPRMADAILVAVFAFGLVVALAVAARAARLALLALVVGAGWPATLLGGGGELGRGALVLAAALVLLLGTTRRPALGAAALAGGVLLAAGTALATAPAVAHRELVAWQHWDPYDRPDPRVGVRYVWDAQYGGIRFPAKRTVVLRVEAPPTSSYWRAGTLDEFAAGRWLEDYGTARRSSAGVDPLLPRAAQSGRRLVRERVTVEALRDEHLVGGSVPVRFDAVGVPLVRPAYGVALLPGGAPRGFTYDVEAYAPQPRPAELERSPARYPSPLSRYLRLAAGTVAPPFGSPSRRTLPPALRAYAPLAERALTVTHGARTPYEAAVRLESWFRARGGFRYDEHPRQHAGVPPLVDFVTRTHAGYCQHFAGAMSLMLRMLGIPARVAVGFSSGSYDAGARTWTVTDHDAHAWVEVWFRGYGWLPFDPTPGRGRLTASYSTGSPDFLSAAPGALTRALGLLGGPSRLAEREPQPHLGGAAVRNSRSFPWAGIALPAALLATVLLLGLAKLARRRGRYLTRDPRLIGSACRRELAEFLSDQRLGVPRTATLGDLGGVLATELAIDGSAFVSAAETARFGPPSAAAHAGSRARRELRLLRRELRRRLGLRARARGFVSLRSLGPSG
jgi:transglutaminase-like putative cysteine protease